VCDSTSSSVAATPTADHLDAPIGGLRLGVPRSMLRDGVDAGVLAGLDAALEMWRAAGADIVDVELPHAPHAIPVYYLVAPAEASSNLARYDGVRYGFRAPLGPRDSLDMMYERTRDAGFGAEVKRRILIGTYVLSAGYYDAFYLKAQQVRTLIRDDYTQAFTSVDAIVMPTTPSAAFRLGERVDHPLQMYLNDVFTVSANLAGVPAVSVPCGLTDQRLPVGIQVVGPAFSEGRILQIARALECRLPRLTPPL
jgi:aspartyl-tRNA(Asn)/glutamyl-tRNA(Gln) amidotransferase subunit A